MSISAIPSQRFSYNRRSDYTDIHMYPIHIARSQPLSSPCPPCASSRAAEKSIEQARSSWQSSSEDCFQCVTSSLVAALHHEAQPRPFHAHGTCLALNVDRLKIGTHAMLESNKDKVKLFFTSSLTALGQAAASQATALLTTL